MYIQTQPCTSLGDVLNHWHAHAERYYRRRDGTHTREHQNYASVLNRFERFAGCASEAGKINRHQVRAWLDQLAAEKLTRGYINACLRKLRTVVRWCADNELVPVAVVADLSLVRSLQAFRSPAIEAQPVPAVSAQNMQAICKQAHAALPLGWLGIAFNKTGATIEALRGSVMPAEKTASGADLSGQVRALIKRCQGSTRTVIFESGSHPLATTINSQIVLEPITHSGLVVGCLVAGERYMIDNEPDVASQELLLLGALGDFLGTFHKNAARFAEHRSMSLGTLAALSAAIDAKDPYTHGHSERVAMVAQLIAQKIGMSEAEAERIRIAGLVHDVGKIGVPENILCRAGRLSDDELKQIKQHPEIGYRILAEIPALQDVLPGVLHHHEQFNGMGYPHALAGDAIPLIARIIGLADTFDAMSSSRAYRQALPMQKVLAEIKRCAGIQLDPAVVEAFMTIDLSEYHAVLPGQEQSVETASKNGPATTDTRAAA